jgi:hypothetical protein
MGIPAHLSTARNCYLRRTRLPWTLKDEALMVGCYWNEANVWCLAAATRSEPSMRNFRLVLLFGIVSSVIAPPEKGAKFKQAIDQQAKPEIDDGPEVDCPRLVLSGGRQVRRKGKIQGVAKQDSDQEFDPFGACKWHGSKHFRR